MESLIDDATRGCFLCNPEPWRVIYEGEHVRVLAGLGPLCPGYVLVAPKEHIGTSAMLQDAAFAEFSWATQRTISAFERQYGPGYSAYEHGRLGACYPSGAEEERSKFCEHSHRVLIPRTTNVLNEISAWFDDRFELPTDESIRELSNVPYVFYETATLRGTALRYGFTGDKGIPPQFMRRILSDYLKNGRHYSWAIHFNYPEMIDTVSRLRTEFIGLGKANLDVILDEKRDPRFPISIDGFAVVGKTTVASWLGRRYDCPVVDTGLVFRLAAHRMSHGQAKPSVAETRAFLLETDRRSYKPPAPESLVFTLAQDQAYRVLYDDTVNAIIADARRCVLVGRDTWKFSSNGGATIIVKADLDIRIQRRLLLLALAGTRSIDVQQVKANLDRGDTYDITLLPPANLPGLMTLYNGRRSIAAMVRHCTQLLEE